MQSQSVSSPAAENHASLSNYTLGFTNQCDADLQARLEAIDARLREKYGMEATQAAVGILDLKRLRLGMIHPDRIEYAASVPKIGILLAWFETHPEAASKLDAATRHELGLMIKASSNEMAAKYSRELGLRRVQQALDNYHFYDTNHGGGIWVGKHYGQGGERMGDPIADHSHAATVRQLLRFYLLLEQGRLVSVEASRRMIEIFAAPEIPHEENKFVKGLSDRGLAILRKSGSWEDWLHDTALVRGPSRRYILVALTHHPKGDDYLGELARSVDDLMKE